MKINNLKMKQQCVRSAFLKASLVLIFVLVGISTHAASKISYLYDAAGNRITRAIIIQEVIENTVLDSSIKNAHINDSSIVDNAEKEIHIYPNPTQGIVMVDISNMDENAQSSLVLLDLKGKPIVTRKKLQANNQIDFTNTSSGTYIMRINLDGKNKTYKIIKK